MAKLNATLTLEGKSGKSYKFKLFDENTKFKSISAVYLFTKRAENDNGGFSHKYVYIGQAKDLSQRFDNHHKAKCIANNKANCIGVHSCEESELDEIEKDLLLNNKTKCNEKLN